MNRQPACPIRYQRHFEHNTKQRSAPVDIGALPKDIKEIVGIFDTTGGNSEKLAQFATEAVDTGDLQKRPNEQRHEDLDDFDAVATPLSAHATLKQPGKIVFGDTGGNLVVGQRMDLRKGVGNWSVGSPGDLFAFFAAWSIVGFILSIHITNLDQAAYIATKN